MGFRFVGIDEVIFSSGKPLQSPKEWQNEHSGMGSGRRGLCERVGGSDGRAVEISALCLGYPVDMAVCVTRVRFDFTFGAKPAVPCREPLRLGAVAWERAMDVGCLFRDGAHLAMACSGVSIVVACHRLLVFCG